MAKAPAVLETAASEDRLFVCQECGASYGRERALKRHMSTIHDAPLSASALRKRKREGKEAPKPPAAKTPDRLSARLAAFAAPLLEERAEIQRELERAKLRVSDLREEVRSYDAALRRIDPDLVAKKPQPAGQDSQTRKFDPENPDDAAKIVRVEEYLLAHDELDDGFTINNLQARMQATGAGISDHKMRQIVATLHERGIVRKDRVVKGGGNLYVLIGRNGDGAQ